MQKKRPCVLIWTIWMLMEGFFFFSLCVLSLNPITCVSCKWTQTWMGPDPAGQINRSSFREFVEWVIDVGFASHHTRCMVQSISSRWDWSIVMTYCDRECVSFGCGRLSMQRGCRACLPPTSRALHAPHPTWTSRAFPFRQTPLWSLLCFLGTPNKPSVTEEALNFRTLFLSLMFYVL